MNELEDISGAEIYHCSRDDDGKFKEGLCARLRRHTSQLGCWKHLISGRPPTTEDAERLLEANVMEVLALLTLWYQDPFHFQLSYESVLDPELRMSYLPCMTPVLGHVEYFVPPQCR
ncbi:hypothetical protein MPTK1_3g17530 [Marchantia polymorpha subsp. ruderalis]|uniref:Uncharacterized protein n=2 Tax=Marchantia polymorpha TaxID=3197 RepID=A0AAF6B1V6_MARPO|nr:hypothetical protein MARPO_0039s0041 [Marchantia polymorpha]BBN05990.1 hypothetical protein Mp_3g17530 [Marchantia polymorpha subsp. ruderalis]|eukprot:PTQ40534.1 hypothetical protein MARPO_0039s0041 [Marchantia polymorpha]